MNATKSTAQQREPSEIELLLPWYAAGTLDPRDAQAVEAALANDPELLSRLEWARSEFAEETALNEASGEPPADDDKVLFARIDALPPRRAGASGGAIDLVARVGEFFASLSPQTLAWAAAAAVLAIVLQAGVLADFALKEKILGDYETTSVPAGAPADGSYVLMRFAPQATAADIATFLTTNKLSIVDGPSGGQLFTVRVAPTKLSKAELSRIVKTLQDDKVVGFVVMTD
jgi:hypothetical protein